MIIIVYVFPIFENIVIRKKNVRITGHSKKGTFRKNGHSKPKLRKRGIRKSDFEKLVGHRITVPRKNSRRLTACLSAERIGHLLSTQESGGSHGEGVLPASHARTVTMPGTIR